MTSTLSLSQQHALTSAAALKLKSTLPSSTVRGWVTKTLNAGIGKQKLSKKMNQTQLTIRWVGEPEGRELNHAHRGQGVGKLKNYATNVLTFAYGIDQKVLSADIVLCWPVLLSEAKSQSKTVRHHAAHLIIHGVLHALGFDHETDAEAEIMEGLEIDVLSQLRITNPYVTFND